MLQFFFLFSGFLENMLISVTIRFFLTFWMAYPQIILQMLIPILLATPIELQILDQGVIATLLVYGYGILNNWFFCLLTTMWVSVLTILPRLCVIASHFSYDARANTTCQSSHTFKPS
jgi:hypothetical protein